MFEHLTKYICKQACIKDADEPVKNLNNKKINIKMKNELKTKKEQKKCRPLYVQLIFF